MQLPTRKQRAEMAADDAMAADAEASAAAQAAAAAAVQSAAARAAAMSKEPLGGVTGAAAPLADSFVAPSPFASPSAPYPSAGFGEGLKRIDTHVDAPPAADTALPPPQKAKAASPGLAVMAAAWRGAKRGLPRTSTSVAGSAEATSGAPTSMPGSPAAERTASETETGATLFSVNGERRTPVSLSISPISPRAWKKPAMSGGSPDASAPNGPALGTGGGRLDVNGDDATTGPVVASSIVGAVVLPPRAPPRDAEIGATHATASGRAGGVEEEGRSSSSTGVTGAAPPGQRPAGSGWTISDWGP